MTKSVPALLNIGFYNYIAISQVVAILDAKSAVGRRLVTSLKKEGKIRSILDASGQRAVVSVIVLLGDRLALSAIPRKQLAKRMGAAYDLPDPKGPYKKLGRPKGSKDSKPRKRRNAQTEEPADNLGEIPRDSSGLPHDRDHGSPGDRENSDSPEIGQSP